MENELRVAKKCPVCGQRLFDKVSLATGFVEIKCPNCKHITRINLACRQPRAYAHRTSRYRGNEAGKAPLHR